MTRPSLCPQSALVAHLESLIADSRVLVIGDASRSIVEHLLDRGARLVQLLDPDANRVAHAAAHNTERRVTFAQLTDGSLRDASFDCVIVEDVELTSNLKHLVTQVARSLSSSGIAALCMRSDEETTGLLGARRGNTDYDSFCESVEDVFEASIMLGQTPFVGYSVVQFDLEHPPEPALDNAYLNGEGEAPDFYIALCGSSDALASLNQEDMTIVQLPATRFVKDNDGMRGELQRRAERRAEALQSELSSLRRKEQDAETAKLETELEQRDAWIRQLEARAESADARADDAQAQVDELEQELDDALTALENTRQDADAAISARDLAQKELQELLDKRAREPSAGLSAEDFEDLKEELADTVLLLNKRTAELSDKGKQLSELKLKLKDSARHQEEAEHVSVGRDALEVELSSLDGRARKLEAALSDKSRQMERLERRLVEQEKELDDLHDQLSETEDMLSKARLELEEHAGHRTEELERDVRGFEQQLSDRGHRIIELEGQLRKLEAYAKTLKLELEASAPARPSNGDSTVPNSDEVDKLAQALAEREADLLEAQWKIGQLTQTAVRE